MSEEELLRRVMFMTQFLKEGEHEEGFFPWADVYCWSDGSDYVWSLLEEKKFPWLHTRMWEEDKGLERQVMYLNE
jgi:hypothetical protein